MAGYLFNGGRFLDPRQDELLDGVSVLVEDGTVKEVSDRPIAGTSATRIDLRGRTLMPGLIDCHIHVVLTEVNLRLLADVPLTLLAAKGSVAMRAMLHRGFTTLRDTGGADYGIKAAVEQGLFEGPRAVHRRPAAEPDRRPRRSPAAHAGSRILRLLLRPVLDRTSGRRGARGASRRRATNCARAPTTSSSWYPAASPRRRIRWRACSTASTRSRPRSTRRRAGAHTSARMPIRRRRSRAR